MVKGSALTIVRSLGQAFDVCHKLNPRPKKKKSSKESSPETESSIVNEKEDLSTTDKKPEENGVPEENKPPAQNAKSAWKQFEDSTEKPSGVSNENTPLGDLVHLSYDPFMVPGQSNQSKLPNGGNTIDPFQPTPGNIPPMLTVGNTSMALPDFPEGIDPAIASANVPPAHMALLGRPRPRPTSAGHNQVGSIKGDSIWLFLDDYYKE